jgi:hypothetical protein
MERAEPLERGARLLQLDRLADDVDDGELVLDLCCDACGRGDSLVSMTMGLSSLDRPIDVDSTPLSRA